MKISSRLEISSITEDIFNSWEKSRQEQYLNEHPTSKFGKKPQQVERKGAPKKNDAVKDKNMSIVKKDPWRVVEMNNPSDEVMLEAIKRDKLLLQNMDVPERIQDKITDIDPSSIYYIDNPSKKVQMKLVKKDPSLVSDIKEPCKEALDYISDNYPEDFISIFYEGGIPAKDFKNYLENNEKVKKEFSRLGKSDQNRVNKVLQKRLDTDKRIEEMEQKKNAQHKVIPQEKAEQKRKEAEKIRTPEYVKLDDQLKNGQEITLFEGNYASPIRMQKTKNGNYRIYFDGDKESYKGTPFSSDSRKSFATPEEAISSISKFLIKDYKLSDLEDLQEDMNMNNAKGIGAELLKTSVFDKIK